MNEGVKSTSKGVSFMNEGVKNTPKGLVLWGEVSLRNKLTNNLITEAMKVVLD